MASLQIPFTKWDWPSKRNMPPAGQRHCREHSCYSRTSTLGSIYSLGADGSSVFSLSPSSLTVTKPVLSNESTDNYLSSMLLEGQAVLSHQLANGNIWLFVGLSNGSIWKWTIRPEGRDCLTAELVMTAHSSPVKALAIASYRTDHAEMINEQQQQQDGVALVESLISLDEAGEMAVWNCHDGRCLLHNLRATASGKAAGFATSISVSPNSEYCVVSGFSDKLVVLRLATLEIVQIIEVAQGREPRWVRSAGFLLQDDPNLLLDYLTLNFNAPPAESLTARQFDPQLGRFVSAACPILPATLTPLQLAAFSSCHLLCCSTFNPGLAALVTRLRQVWLIDFLRGDHTAFMLDFEVDGVEFVRADLLLIWSKSGSVAFYQLFLDQQQQQQQQQADEGQDTASVSNYDSEREDPITPGSTTRAASIDERATSPLLGSIVRRLDVSCPFMTGGDASTRLHLRLLPRPTQLLWMEVKEGAEAEAEAAAETETEPIDEGGELGRACRVSIVQIRFDSASMDRTVYLDRVSSMNLSLRRGRGSHAEERLAVSSNRGCHLTSSADAASAAAAHPEPPVTCMIPFGQDSLLQGHFNGQVSLRSVVDFFAVASAARTVRYSAASSGPAANAAPITALFHGSCGSDSGSDSGLIAAGDLHGRLHFWDSELRISLGRSRAHTRRVLGIERAGRWLLSWSEGGVVALHQRIVCTSNADVSVSASVNEVGDKSHTDHTGHCGIGSRFATVHVFYPPSSAAQLSAIYFKSSDSTLLLDYRSVRLAFSLSGSGSAGPSSSSSSAAVIAVLLPLSDSALLETIALADMKISLSLQKNDQGSLMDGVVAVQPVGWPQLPCHSITIDVRNLITRMKQHQQQRQGATTGIATSTATTCTALAAAVLSQLLAWKVSPALDVFCREELRLPAPHHLVHYGLVGANGNISSLLQSDDAGAPFWTRSPTLTATLQLAILVLLDSLSGGGEMNVVTDSDGISGSSGNSSGSGNCTFNNCNYNNNCTFNNSNNYNTCNTCNNSNDTSVDIASIKSFYAIRIGNEQSVPPFKPASASLVSKFWQDPHPSLQQSARLIFSSSFSRLDDAERRILVEYWRDLLPASTTTTTTTTATTATTSMNRSIIILSIIALQQQCHPADYGLSLKVLADGLVNLLVQDERRSLFRLAAVELIGRGYEGLWRTVIHGQSIFRMLFGWYKNGIGIGVMNGSIRLEVIEAAKAIEAAKTIEDSKAAASAAKPVSQTTAVIEKALLNILIAEGDQMLQLLGDAANASPIAAFRLFFGLLTAKPVLLVGRERDAVEMLLMTPMRCEEELLLEALQRMAEMYGTVALLGRLVAASNGSCASAINNASKETSASSNASTSNATNATKATSNANSKANSNPPTSNPINPILVFDLKSKVKTATLAGHAPNHPPTLLHFHSSRLLLSYSAAEATIRWWPLSSAGASLNPAPNPAAALFFGPAVLDAGSVAQSARMIVVRPELTAAVDCLPGGSVFAMRPVEARSDPDSDHVQLLVGGQVMMLFKV